MRRPWWTWLPCRLAPLGTWVWVVGWLATAARSQVIRPAPYTSWRRHQRAWFAFSGLRPCWWRVRRRP